MKRILFAVLVVCVLLPSAAIAEEPFSLRNGYMWGMTKDEIGVLAAEEGIEIKTEAQDKMSCKEVSVGGYSGCGMRLYFKIRDDGEFGLSSIRYNFDFFWMKKMNANQQTVYNEILDKLTSIYGDPLSTKPSIAFADWKTKDTDIRIRSRTQNSLYIEYESTALPLVEYRLPNEGL